VQSAEYFHHGKFDSQHRKTDVAADLIQIQKTLFGPKLVQFGGRERLVEITKCAALL
jgi:hypothetical protein